MKTDNIRKSLKKAGSDNKYPNKIFRKEASKLFSSHYTDQIIMKNDKKNNSNVIESDSQLPITNFHQLQDGSDKINDNFNKKIIRK